jgi:GNAT superfamily N-acetyltransferase
MESPTRIEVRAADHGDVSAILQCLTAAFAPFRTEYTPAAFADTVLSQQTLHLRMRQMRVLVATVGGSVVGTVSGVCHAGEGHLRGMAVLPGWHGRGVAAELLAAIEDWLRSHRCNRITLDTTLPLKAAMKFYEKSGYEQSGKVTDFFAMPLIEYEKYL